MIVYLDESKNYYKANLHCHTTRSDGRATPEQVKEEYKKRGYSAVAFTDHDHLLNCSHLTDESFVAINGFELSVAGRKIDEAYSPRPSSVMAHINFLSKDPDCDVTPCYHDKYDWYKFEDLRHLVKYDEPYTRVYSHEGINDMIRIGHERGFLITLNHPNWSFQTAEDYLGYKDLDFIEVYNTGTILSGHHDDEAALDNMMKAGKRIFPVAADDNHNIHGFEGSLTDSFRGWVMINSERLGYGELMSALEAGNFYASTGPEIYSLTLNDEGVVSIKTSGVSRIFLISQGRRNCRLIAEEGKLMYSGSFRIPESVVRFRIRIDDEYGRSAYTGVYDIPEDTPRIEVAPKK